MAEYWKSQPKKFCDFCKCWIADNKASVDFHEKGKKHQENVKLRIQEVKKKGAERRQQQEQLHDDLAAIEAAALKAYKKDIGYSDISRRKDSKDETTSCKQENKTEESCAATVHTCSSDNDTWAAYQTPEGYWYYFNKESGESRWDPPRSFSMSGQQQNLQQSKPTLSEQNYATTLNDAVVDQESNEHNGPFGKWETVAVYERDDVSETKQEDGEKEDKQDEVPVVKFKEKQLPLTKKNNLGDTNVIFKKRKSNQGKKRSIRQRTDDS